MVISMRIDIERVRNYFTLYSSLSPSESVKWDILCRKAASFVESRLREDADPCGHMDRLAHAAALWAYGDYLSLGSGFTSSDEIKVGDITVKQSASSGGGRSPDKLKEQALEDIGDLMVSSGFVFKAFGEGGK